MSRLNFEKSAIFVLALIVLISTANISAQYIALLFQPKSANTVEVGDVRNITFPVMLLKADKLYSEGRYEEARDEYLRFTLISTLNPRQKAASSFKLGLCYFKLDKYENARTSFLTSIAYEPNDPIAYNNAAVSAYCASNYELAEEYQRQAIVILPVVEYYYNLGRILEKTEHYSDAVKYYAAFILGEENVSKEDRVDPVRVKNKVARLLPDKRLREVVTEDLMIALKLKDPREVFIIDDTDMTIKSNDFRCDIEDRNDVRWLRCGYEREANDPYHLIDSLEWVVTSGSRTVYTSNKDQLSIRISNSQDYVVNLYIAYNGTKELHSSKKINSKKVIEKQQESQTAKNLGEISKYYIYAAYEQVFEQDFNISTKGFVDRFNTVWGKDSLETEIMGEDFMDTASSLRIKNTLSRDAGIWADLTSLLEEKKLKGKTINIKFYARKINSTAKIDARARVKAGPILYAYDNFELDFKWKLYSLNLYIPPEATGLTFSLNIRPEDEVKVDGFIISVAQ